MTTRTFRLSLEAAGQLEAVRVRSGHLDATATVEWLIRAMADKYRRIDRENAADAKQAAEVKP